MDQTFTLGETKGFDLPDGWVEAVNKDCFALRGAKGCMALNYTAKELEEHNVCETCKFKKTLQKWLADKKRATTKSFKGFFLIMDNENKGFFKTIKDIDEWLKYYWEVNKDEEQIPETTEQNDYNVLFITHEIRFIY